MAVQPNSFMTMLDWAATRDPNGGTAMYANLLSQCNEIHEDVLYTEANTPTGHEMTVLTGLPTPTWRRFNSGSQPSKTTKARIRAGMGKLEDFAVLDKDLASLNGDTAQFRLQEDHGHIEGLSQTMAGNFIYGNELTNDASFNGLSQFYSQIAGIGGQPAPESAKNIVDCGGTSTGNTSMWLVQWGPNSTFGIFQKGTTAGLEMEDVTGSQPVLDGNGGRYMAYQTRYAWRAGLAVKDWRFNSRACNIDCNALGTPQAADLLATLTKMVYKSPVMPRRVTAINKTTDARGGDMVMPAKAVFYVNRTIHEYLDLQSQQKLNVRLKYDEVDGVPQLTFRGIAIKTVDQILTTEARVV